MAKILDGCKLVCMSHTSLRGPQPCDLPQGHAGYCLCKKCDSLIHLKRRPVGEIVQTEEAAEVWKNWKPVIVGLILVFLPLFAHAQELNLNVRDVFPRDAWAQGAFLVGRPENFGDYAVLDTYNLRRDNLDENIGEFEVLKIELWDLLKIGANLLSRESWATSLRLFSLQQGEQ